MQKIKGKYAAATIFTDNVEDYALAQIKMICDNEAAIGSKIRVMPDVHPGKVGPVGLTMTVKDRVMPALVGEDIGCGISYIKFKAGKVEFQKMDRVIRENIPAGFDIRSEPHRNSRDFDVQDLICAKHINHEKAYLSLGTLGGGNHFIELDKDDEGYMYAFVHSGNRSTVISEHTVREYRKCLEGVYSSTISKETLDEAPFAYRGIDEILENIKDTVEVKKILKPVYNYKAGSKEKK